MLSQVLFVLDRLKLRFVDGETGARALRSLVGAPVAGRAPAAEVTR